MTHTKNESFGESSTEPETDGICLPLLTDELADELGLPRGTLELAYVADRRVADGLYVIVNGWEHSLPPTPDVLSIAACRFLADLKAFVWRPIKPSEGLRDCDPDCAYCLGLVRWHPPRRPPAPSKRERLRALNPRKTWR